MTRTFRTITVAELINALQDEDPDARVIFATDYGDYCHTEQALPIKGEIETATIKPSAYSTSGFATVVSDDEDDVEMERARNADGPDDEAFLVIR